MNIGIPKLKPLVKTKKPPYGTKEYKKIMWMIETKEPFASIAKEVFNDSKNDRYPHDSFHVKVLKTIIDNYNLVKK